MRILITRPTEDAARFAARLEKAGHASVVAPLMEPRFDGGPLSGLSGVQALLITSANGVSAFAGACARRDLPVFAVGPQTAAKARAAGFADVRDADGDVHALAARAMEWAGPGDGALVHVCSHEAPGTLVDLLAKAGFDARALRLYRMEEAAALPAAARLALARGELDAVMFFSPAAARVFRQLLTGQDRALVAPLAALCISANTARALAPLAFGDVRIAAKPNQDAMLALVERSA